MMPGEKNFGDITTLPDGGFCILRVFQQAFGK